MYYFDLWSSLNEGLFVDRKFVRDAVKKLNGATSKLERNSSVFELTFSWKNELWNLLSKSPKVGKFKRGPEGTLTDPDTDSDKKMLCFCEKEDW